MIKVWKTCNLSAIIIITCVIPAAATIINVPDDYPTIQQGIDVSADGDTVLVQPGTYVENVNFNGHNITVGSLFLTTHIHQYISLTYISGNNSGSVVSMQNGENETASLVGFTIENGNGSSGGGIYCHESNPTIRNNIIKQNGVESGQGGGIYCVYSDAVISHNTIKENTSRYGAGIFCLNSDATIIDNEIYQNEAHLYSGGGGIYIRHSNVLIEGNTIQENSARRGGGIYCQNSSTDIVNNIIIENVVDDNGGAIFIEETDPLISKNIIKGNSAENGGGICCYYSDSVIRNNLIVSNTATEEGAGLYSIFGSNPEILNNTFYANTAGERGGGLYSSGPQLTIRNTIFWANFAPEGSQLYPSGATPAITFCDIQGGWDGMGNIDTDPLFRNPQNGGFRLRSIECGDSLDSPCIDAGHFDVLDETVDCLWGLKTPLSDMGAFGGGELLPHMPGVIEVPSDLPTIQIAINSSSNGDTVLVHPGYYSENIAYFQHDIIVGSLFLTTGDTSMISQTVIDGNALGHVVSFNSMGETTAALIGFTITNGYASSGGGIYCYNSTPLVSHNIIRQNISTRSGGGMSCPYTEATIVNNVFLENTAFESGGALLCSYTSVTNNSFIGNESVYFGGAIFENFSSALISNNVFDGNTSAYGGAIGNFGNPTIDNNIMINNTASDKGGAVYCAAETSPQITSNTINGNHAVSGGGIYLDLESGSSISDNLIDGNFALFGGGIYCESEASIVENTLVENTAPFGAGIYCSASNPIITGNAIFSNSASMRGAGIYCFVEANPIIANNIITGNTGNAICLLFSSPDVVNNVIAYNSSEVAGGLYSIDSKPAVVNSIFWDNDSPDGSGIRIEGEMFPMISYSDIQGGWEGEGNIDTDPLFRDPENNDFHLMSTECSDPYDSPCIDSGSPDIIDSLLDCSWGLGTTVSDMGAYGGGDSVVVGIDDFIAGLPESYSLLQNYPNPFNSSTTIKYDLPEQSDVRIEIYNILGEKVATLFEGNREAGSYTVIWQARDCPSGVYFARLQLAGHSENIKMVLLK